MNEQWISDAYGRRIGKIESDNKGNKTVKDFYGRQIGYYKKDIDMTTDFYGRPLYKGDVSSSLINRN